MGTSGKDDFGAFAGAEHMFFGLRDPFGMIREKAEGALRKQVQDTVLESIATFDEPKFLTLGAEEDGGSKVRVTHFGFCVRARFIVSAPTVQRHAIEATITFIFGDVDKRGSETCRTFFDLGADAERCFTDELFKERFIAFRVD